MTDRDSYHDWAEDDARFEAEDEAAWQDAEAASQAELEATNAEVEQPDAPTAPETPA